MKIASIVTQMKYSEENVSKLEALGEFIQHDVNKLAEAELVEYVKDIDYLVLGSSGIQRFSKKVFEAAKNLKVISVLGSGVDVIDIDAAKTHGVAVCNAKGANAQSVAEHVFGTVLSLSKRITESHNGLENENKNFESFEGIELFKKQIGIVGFGEIGSRVAKIAEGFSMDIQYNRASDLRDSTYSYVELDELFESSDVIVITVPGNDSTKNLIHDELLKKVKQNCILVSISREYVIDENTIFELLDEGRLFGYGFDADINETPNKKFYNYPNVIITPHTAFFTSESEINVENTAVNNIITFDKGEPQNLVV